LIDQLKFYLKF